MNGNYCNPAENPKFTIAINLITFFCLLIVVVTIIVTYSNAKVQTTLNGPYHLRGIDINQRTVPNTSFVCDTIRCFIDKTNFIVALEEVAEVAATPMSSAKDEVIVVPANDMRLLILFSFTILSCFSVFISLVALFCFQRKTTFTKQYYNLSKSSNLS